MPFTFVTIKLLLSYFLTLVSVSNPSKHIFHIQLPCGLFVPLFMLILECSSIIDACMSVHMWFCRCQIPVHQSKNEIVQGENVEIDAHSTYSSTFSLFQHMGSNHLEWEIFFIWVNIPYNLEILRSHLQDTFKLYSFTCHVAQIPKLCE